MQVLTVAVSDHYVVVELNSTAQASSCIHTIHINARHARHARHRIESSYVVFTLEAVTRQFNNIVRASSVQLVLRPTPPTSYGFVLRIHHQLVN